MLTLLMASLLLGACSLSNSSGGSQVIINDDSNYDEDKTVVVVDDGEENEYDIDKDEVDTNVTAPETFDQLENNVIESAGNYQLSGDYTSVSITASKNSEVYVFLDGVNINSTTGVAFGSSNKITLHLVLLNNSTNTIVNDFLDTNAFHVKGDVYISGNGTLNIESKQKNGLKVSKDLYVSENVVLNVTGQNHAITARSITTNGAEINVVSNGKDGLQLECDSDVTSYTSDQGFAYLENTKFTADTKGDGIQADTFVYISGGEYDITTHGEFVSYSTANMQTYGLETDDFKFVKSGNTYKRVAKDSIRSLSSNYDALANSVKGIKAGAIEYDTDNDDVDDVTITTGDYDIYIAHAAKITVNSYDDCIHTNYGDVTIDSAALVLDTYDDGVHADYDLSVKNASITINSSYEGLEGATVTIDGDNTALVLYASDDGINAASDLSNNCNIYIKGGYLRVYASGDGLDANTGLYLQGGTVIVEGPGSGNGSLDAENVYFQGGIVFACSTSGMTERMNATQNTFLWQGTTLSANSKVSVVDENNNAIFSYTLKQSCNQIIFSSPDLQLNKTYTLASGTTSLASIKLTSSLTKVGNTQGGGGPGGGPHH